MPDVLEHHSPSAAQQGRPPPVVPPREGTDERPARRTLQDQIAKLEGELSALFISSWPRKGFDLSVSAPARSPRLLSLGELELLRDDLAQRVDDGRRELGDRTWVEQQHRGRIEAMLLEPERHKWVRVSNEDIGEPGCRHWHVLPRWGILGMFLNWWRVRISSGCPLAEGRGRWPRPGAPHRPLDGSP